MAAAGCRIVRASEHILEVELLQPGVEAYCFTFG
jgi:hypothetical protein